MKFLPKKQSDKNAQPPQSARRRPVATGQEARRAQAFSYYARRSATPANTGRGGVDTSSEVVRNSDQSVPKALNKLGITVAGLVLLVGAVSMLRLDTEPKIVARTANGGTYFMQEPTVYQMAAAHALQASILNRNKLTVDTTKVSRDITASYPEIASARVELPLFGAQPVVYVEPHRPTFILTTNDSAAYLLDENGRALVSTSQISDPGELSVPTIQDKSGIKVTLGSQALPAGIIDFTESLLITLKAAKVEYATLALPAASSELDVTVKAAQGKSYFVKFNLQGEVRQQAGTFLATKARLEKDRVMPEQYIDVRVPERAYYK